MPVTLINTFKVPAEQEQEFLKRWSETTSVYARTSGFIETHMHRNTGVGNPTLTTSTSPFGRLAKRFSRLTKIMCRAKKAYRVSSSIRPFMKRSS
jgi:hypothetical protein